MSMKPLPANRIKLVKRIRHSVLNLTNLPDEFLCLDKLEQGKWTVHFNEVEPKCPRSWRNSKE